MNEEQKRVCAERLQGLFAEVIERANNKSDISRIFDALYKLKFSLEYEAKVGTISVQKLEKKAIKSEVEELLQKCAQ